MLVQEEGGGSDLLEHLALLLFWRLHLLPDGAGMFQTSWTTTTLSWLRCPILFRHGKKMSFRAHQWGKSVSLIFNKVFGKTQCYHPPLNATQGMMFRGWWPRPLGFTQNWSVLYCRCLLRGLIAGVWLCLIFRIGAFWMFFDTFLQKAEFVIVLASHSVQSTDSQQMIETNVFFKIFCYCF